MYYGEPMIYAVFHIAIGLIKIASCFKQGNNAINVFICGILPSDDTPSINRQLTKETNNIFNPIKAELFEGSFFWRGRGEGGGQYEPHFIFQEELM